MKPSQKRIAALETIVKDFKAEVGRVQKDLARGIRSAFPLTAKEVSRVREIFKILNTSPEHEWPAKPEAAELLDLIANVSKRRKSRIPVAGGEA